MLRNKVFVDTNPIIYYLNEQEPFASKFLVLLEKYIKLDAEFYTSTITDAEILVKPYSENNIELIYKYKNFLSAADFLKCYITNSVAETSAKLRAKYNSLKLADSLQIATALDCGCGIFITNDKHLKQISEIIVEIIDEVEL